MALTGSLLIARLTTHASIRLTTVPVNRNLELAKKPAPCLEYIVVHELAHLLEKSHGDRFIALMDKHLPQWRARKQELKEAPLAHEAWGY
jgi:predicted metal-dependent hydrolase